MPLFDLTLPQLWLAMSAPVVCLFAMNAALHQTSDEAVVDLSASAAIPALLYAGASACAVALSPSWPAALGLTLLLATLGYLAAFDLRSLSVPIAPIAIMIVLGPAFGLLEGWSLVAERAGAAVVAWLAFALLAFGYRLLRGRDGLGAGDGWIGALIGAWLSFEGVAWSVVFGGAALLAWRIVQRAPPDKPAPFAPGLAAGALLVVLTMNAGISP